MNIRFEVNAETEQTVEFEGEIFTVFGNLTIVEGDPFIIIENQEP